MRPAHRQTLARWLAAERGGRPQEAEAALGELLAALPLAAPPAGFADRVLARAGILEARRDLFASWRVRLALALSLTALAFGALWLPPVLSWLADLWSLGAVVRGGVLALTEAARWLGSALRVWELMLTIGRALTVPLTLPQVSAVLTAGLVAASLALRYLRDQISGERNWTYVDPV